MASERIKAFVSKFDRDNLHSKMKLTDLGLCGNIWKRFGLYIIKLRATVTLTFDGLISKSTEIIYTMSIIPFPNKPWILCVCSKRLINTLWEKEKFS